MSLRVAYRRVMGLIAEQLFDIPSKSSVWCKPHTFQMCEFDHTEWCDKTRKFTAAKKIALEKPRYAATDGWRLTAFLKKNPNPKAWFYPVRKARKNFAVSKSVTSHEACA